MQKIIDLTFPIHEGMTTYPAPWHPVVKLQVLGRHGIENRETRKIIMGTHTGTHCDAPLHFVPGGPGIDSIPLERLLGPAAILNFCHARPLQEIGIQDLESRLKGSVPERLILRFDWSEHWEDPSYYYTQYPFISEEAARWMLRKGIKLLALDTPTPDNPAHTRASGTDSPVHKILLGAGVVLVEYLCNLKAVRNKNIYLIVLPLKIKGADGSPARCIAIEEEEESLRKGDPL